MRTVLQESSHWYIPSEGKPSKEEGIPICKVFNDRHKNLKNWKNNKVGRNLLWPRQCFSHKSFKCKGSILIKPIHSLKANLRCRRDFVKVIFTVTFFFFSCKAWYTARDRLRRFIFHLWFINYPPYCHISIRFWIGYGHCYLPTQDKQTHIFV